MTVSAHSRQAATIVTWSSLVVIMCSCAAFDSRPNGTIIPIDRYVGTWRLVTEEGDLEIEIENDDDTGTLSYSAQSSDPTRNMTETQSIELRQINSITIAIIGVDSRRSEFYKLDILDENNIRVYRINNDYVKEYVGNGTFAEQPSSDVLGFEGDMGTITASPAEIADFVQKPDAFSKQYTELERVIVAKNDNTPWHSKPARIVYILGGAVLVAMCGGYVMTRRAAVS